MVSRLSVRHLRVSYQRHRIGFYRRGLAGITTLQVHSHEVLDTGYASNDDVGASLFGRVWADPNTPKWEENLKFPLGTCVFKVICFRYVLTGVRLKGYRYS